MLFCCLEKCGQRPVDVVFLLDGSRSVRPNNFKIVKDYVKNFTYTFEEIGPNAAQIGVVSNHSRAANSNLNSKKFDSFAELEPELE